MRVDFRSFGSRKRIGAEACELLWRLRRATAIESGLFRQQARQLLKFRRRRESHQERQKIIDSMYRDAVADRVDTGQVRTSMRSVARRPMILQASLMISRARVFTCPTFPHVRSTGLIVMRPPSGAKLARSCSPCNVSIVASHGRGLGIERPTIEPPEEAKPSVASD
jgi:hypothetical protein